MAPVPPPSDHRGRAMVEALIAELIARTASTGVIASEQPRRVFDEPHIDRACVGRC